jgi:phosphoglycerate dehydrogenase-like enzyme
VKWRYDARLLTGSTVVLLGFGAIGRRLAELLVPFAPNLYAVRRQAIDDPRVRRVGEGELPDVLARADHVVNLLPASDATRHYVNAALLAQFKPGARFYNVGRGATVDQEALLAALVSGRRLSGRRRTGATSARSSPLERPPLLHHPAYRGRPRGSGRGPGAAFPPEPEGI